MQDARMEIVDRTVDPVRSNTTATSWPIAIRLQNCAGSTVVILTAAEARGLADRLLTAAITKELGQSFKPVRIHIPDGPTK